MIALFKFLYKNLKGYRLLVILAMLVTVAQVGSDLLAAMPLKFIPSKVNNPGSDPACTFPFLDPILTMFDTPLLDPSLRPTAPNQPPGQPPPAPCPATSSDPNSVLHPRITQHSVIGVIFFSLIMLALFGMLSALLVYIELYLATLIAQSLSARLRGDLFDHLQRISLDWHDKQKKGDLVQRITGNIADIEKLVNDGIVDLLAGILTLVGVAIAMFFISPSYTVLSLMIAPVLMLLVFVYTSGIKGAARKKAKAAGKIADVATEDINALTVIRAYTLEKRENNRFGQHVGMYRVAGMRAGRLQAQFTPLVAILVVFGTLIVIGIGGYVAAGHAFSIGFIAIGGSTIDVGTLILFLTYLKMLYQPMRDLSKLTTLASNGASGAERIQEVLNQAPEVVEAEKPYEGAPKLKGDIAFEHVYFGYTKERDVLKGIDLHIPAGRKVALVGYSGSGKTTLAKLIPRFYQLERGSIQIDGRSISDYPLQTLRQNISMVLQDSILFEGTLRENLEIGRPGASLEDIIEACIKANIHETIAKLPDGYDTPVREQGNNFSAGQKQRLAIARAILRDAPILILDEPTANLDVEAESEVMHAINTLIAGRTVLTISHRLSTLGNIDEILVMDHGKIVEQGTFKELKRQGGLFAALLEEQNRYNLDRDETDEALYRSAFSTTLPRTPAIKLGSLPRTPASTPVRTSARTPASALAETSPRIPALALAGGKSASNGSNGAHAAGNGNGSRGAIQGDEQTRLNELKERKETPVSTLNAVSDTPRNQHDIPINAHILVQMDGQMIGEYPLKQTISTIGRFPTSDIYIPSERVSRFHALIRWKNGAWILEDAESLNGLTCQGQRIDQLALVDGDAISIDPDIILHYEER
ncbi:MAG TPA: ABC transporter transmembrane domain-containing protein [Ktedonobacteraceae bacterium]|nr:ABC transporter transmembrane domain-containing protein [Ktedonobacteraceae bacterium]